MARPHQQPGSGAVSDDGPESDRQRPESPDEDSRNAAGLGYTLVGALVVGLAIGWAIDAARGSAPTWTVTCAVIFLCIGLYQIIRETLK